MDPRSHRFLDVRFKRARFLWWKYAKTSRRMRRWLHIGSFAGHMKHVRGVRRIFDCPHENRRPNPAAIAVLDRNPEVCLDCGVGIVHRRSPAA